MKIITLYKDNITMAYLIMSAFNNKSNLYTCTHYSRNSLLKCQYCEKRLIINVTLEQTPTRSRQIRDETWNPQGSRFSWRSWAHRDEKMCGNWMSSMTYAWCTEMHIQNRLLWYVTLRCAAQVSTLWPLERWLHLTFCQLERKKIQFTLSYPTFRVIRNTKPSIYRLFQQV